MKIRLPIDIKSLYFNIKNDNETGHTPTVATPLFQYGTYHTHLRPILDIPEIENSLDKEEIASALTIREKIIIEDFVNDIPSKETAIKLSTSVNSIDVMRNRAKNKIKRKLREKDEK